MQGVSRACTQRMLDHAQQHRRIDLIRTEYVYAFLTEGVVSPDSLMW